ncbi:Hypothetical predicted protein [Paramuricea clavata]|uniref:Uncharacterized protein n=1 Tax=Paramuricea clavata TaxID=317549 RepID=A0A7D9IDA7_PARCT|nr:Hypothetical predicted protein [Paramuricea clavata]
MPKKPNKFGIKVWMLADSENYFVPRFQVYLGKQQNAENADENEAEGARGLGFKVVDFLGKPYYNTYRHFYFDNYFSSIPLLEHLLAKKTYACSTLRHNRKYFPADLKKIKLKRGEMRTRQNENLVCLAWQDKRLVTILSTNVDPQPEVFGPLDERTGKRKVVPEEVREKPAVISLYNKYMNGVDVNDQYRSYYPVGAQSKKWWKYLAWFFVNISIVNGFILQNLQTDRRRRLKHLDFRLVLARQLISTYNGYKKISSAPSGRKKDVPVGRNVKGHSLVKSSERKRACGMCSKAGRKRASGRTFESIYKCEQCNEHEDSDAGRSDLDSHNFGHNPSAIYKCENPDSQHSSNNQNEMFCDVSRAKDDIKVPGNEPCYYSFEEKWDIFDHSESSSES